jgi:alkanesulfonate monooxygenase
MSIEVFWQLPVQGDGRSIRPEQWNRGDYSAHRTAPHAFARTGVQRDGYTFYDHLSQIAGSADLARFDGLWIPHTPGGEDPLIAAGAFAREARRLTFVPALRAPLLSAVYAAKIANSFQRLTGGRLAWYLHNEEDTARTWHGRHWSLAEQIERTGEFLDVVKGFWNQAPFTYEGKYFLVENGGFPPPLQGQPLPRIHLSGETPEALALSARHADVHLLPVEPVDQLRERIATLDALAAAHGRTLRYGVVADVVARDTAEEAWTELRRQWDEARAKTVAISSGVAAAGVLPAFDDLRLDAHVWSGFGHLRAGAASGFVGSHDEIAAQVRDYNAIGIETFVLSANPALEETYRIGEKLLPRIRAIAPVTRDRAA